MDRVCLIRQGSDATENVGGELARLNLAASAPVPTYPPYPPVTNNPPANQILVYDYVNAFINGPQTSGPYVGVINSTLFIEMITLLTSLQTLITTSNTLLTNISTYTANIEADVLTVIQLLKVVGGPYAGDSIANVCAGMEGAIIDIDNHVVAAFTSSTPVSHVAAFETHAVL